MASGTDLSSDSDGEGLEVLGVSVDEEVFGAGAEAKRFVAQPPITRRRSFLAALAALCVSCEGVGVHMLGYECAHVRV